MFVGMPLALGSWWGLIAAVPIVPILAWRLTREEAFLCDQLPGYAAYRGRVRHRLAPLIW
jgi:protein-S-isoprenylcysteine O-methyltransferase Ste14